MRLVIGDITKMNTDAIVNAAASDLKPCEGICRAIFNAADTKKLVAACKAAGRCRIGEAVVTPSCGLPCKYIIHAVGTGWYAGGRRADLLFAECYRHALQKAFLYHCKSVAVPLMFSGDFHLPRPEAIRIAGSVIRAFEKEHRGMEIILVLYNKSIYEMAVKILKEDPAKGEEYGQSDTAEKFSSHSGFFFHP